MEQKYSHIKTLERWIKSGAFFNDSVASMILSFDQNELAWINYNMDRMAEEEGGEW